MNKTLIAMAVAGLMAAPMAAQADATIYGKIHVSIDSGDTGGEDATTTIGSFGDKASGIFWQSNSSRIGFKGSEDLGGGLKAVWQYESNAHFGSGNTSWGGRNSYVGLQGGWGTFIGGRHDTPFKTTGRKFDLFGDQVGDSRNLIQHFDGLVGREAGITNWDARPGNAIMYKTPVFGGGWDITALYVLDDAVENSTALSANINWKTGNWYASLAYETQDVDNINPATGQAFPGTKSSTAGYRLGVQWKPGAWKLNAFYHSASDNAGISGLDGNVLGLGAAYKMGKNVLKAQYFMTDNDFVGFTDKVDASLVAVGWDYNFSKRSTAYIAYSTTSNDENVYYCTDAGGHGGEVCSQTLSTNADFGKDPAVLSFGMIHKF